MSEEQMCANCGNPITSEVIQSGAYWIADDPDNDTRWSYHSSCSPKMKLEWPQTEHRGRTLNQWIARSDSGEILAVIHRTSAYMDEGLTGERFRLAVPGQGLFAFDTLRTAKEAAEGLVYKQ